MNDEDRGCNYCARMGARALFRRFKADNAALIKEADFDQIIEWILTFSCNTRNCTIWVTKELIRLANEETRAKYVVYQLMEDRLWQTY